MILIHDMDNTQLIGSVPKTTGDVKSLLSQRGEAMPMAFVHSFGCQQNVSDGEHIKGLLAQMGYGFCDSADMADLVLFNTCAVRESAEDRVYGNIGALKSHKRRNPNLIIGICGCMMQQQSAADKVRESFPYVDIVFGTGAIHMLPTLLYQRLKGQRRVFFHQDKSEIVEGLPSHRAGEVKAWLPIMQGCNNFCSYCIVPYVRGREVSRLPEMVIEEAKEILAAGYKEITLLGQNVNSYGNTLPDRPSFSGLLRELNGLSGDFWVRFMTSHPKDCTKELIDTIAECEKLCNHIHLPVQSGSDRILKAMNRGYSTEYYKELIDYARSRIPGVTFSSDIIVGFPGETREDFEATLKLVESAKFNNLYTFLYSKRGGTKAADMDDPTPQAEKSIWFRELLKLQEGTSSHINEALIGQKVKVLVEGVGRKADGYLAGITAHNTIVEFSGDKELTGRFVWVEVTKAMNWAVVGELVL